MRFWQGSRWFSYYRVVAFYLLVVFPLLPSVSLADVARGKDAIEMEEYAIAWKELLPLADSGDSEAQILVGQMYNNGNGVEADLIKGAEYYKRAAVNGNARAQALLAFLYVIGRGVDRNHSMALHWYQQAANNGDPHAQLDLARMYRTGSGVNLDNVQSYKWYFIVSKNDEICDCLLDGKKIVASKMTPHEIQKAEAMADEWLQQKVIEN